jgi:hypothetical protein
MEVKCLPYRIVYVVKLDFVMLFLSQFRWAKYCRCVGIINNNDYQQVHFVNKSLSLAGSCFWFCSLRIHASEIYLSGPGQAIISAWGQITERINTCLCVCQKFMRQKYICLARVRQLSLLGGRLQRG